jgi:hypothetical protein
MLALLIPLSIWLLLVVEVAQLQAKLELAAEAEVRVVY